MKRVTTFIGSTRKKSAYHAVRRFLDNLQSLGDVKYEIGPLIPTAFLDLIDCPQVAA